MSAELNSIINRMRVAADAKRAELAELDAGIEALAKIQGGNVAATPKRRRKAGNGSGAHPNSAEAKDATLATYMSS